MSGAAKGEEVGEAEAALARRQLGRPASSPASTLAETCPVCKSHVVEGKFDYEGEALAVAVCSICDWFDWEVPKSYNEKYDDSVLNKSEEWARDKAGELRITYELPLKYPFYVSKFALFYLRQKKKEMMLWKIGEAVVDANMEISTVSAYNNRGLKIFLREMR